MTINTEDLDVNILIKKLNATAEKGEGMTLTPEEVKVLAEEMGDLVYVPVLTMEDVARMSNKDKEGKMGMTKF